MDKGFGSKFLFNEKNRFYIRIGLWPVRFFYLHSVAMVPRKLLGVRRNLLWVSAYK